MLDEFRSTYITWDKATSRIYSPVTANASDENGRKLAVQIVNGGQVEDLTGATLHLYWETRDRLHDGLDVFKAVDLKKGEFELSYTTGMLSNKGVLNANLVLIDTVGRVVSERFKITVTEGIDNDAIQSENSFSSLTQALIDISNLEQNYAPRLNYLTAQLQQAVGAVTVDSEVVLARGGEPTLGVRLDKQDDTTKDITSRVNYIEGYIDYRDDDIVGIEADFANSTFTRIAASSGLSAGTDFNAFEPFGGRRRCTVLDNGTVTSYFGDANFAEDGSIGQVMVEQPKFYYKVVPLKLDKVQDGKGFHLRKARYYVSAKHKAGFKIHPAFVPNGKEKNFVYLSAYEGAIYDDSAAAYILDDAQVADFAVDKLSSISGTKPASGLTQNLTRANTRKLAQNRGLGWEQAYGATVAATQLLFAIEYASFNTQTAIGMGVTKTDDATTNMAEPTGVTTLLGNASGKADNGSITYRGEENFWMNIFKWVDGLNIEAKGLHNLFIADNAFADDLGTTPYQDAGITIAKANGYISAFAYNEKFDWLFFPSETIGNTSVPVGDYLYQSNAHNGWVTAVLGGYWNDGANGGCFYWRVTYAASDRHRAFGGRLVYVPGVVA